MTSNIFLTLNHWHWLGFALMLLILELLSMTTYFLWISIGAAVTGLLLWIFPEISWAKQYVIFAISSLAGIFIGNWYFGKNLRRADNNNLNKRNRQYIGRIFTLEEPLVNGMGSVRVDDSIWRVRGSEDFPAGTLIKVTDVDGVILLVEKK